METIQTSPAMDAMATKEYTPREWLTYYKNLWQRNAVSRSVDVQADTVLKAANPDEVVFTQEGQQTTVKERLELRKMSVQEALNFVEAIDALLAIPDEEFVAKCWSKEALAVAPDMMPPAEKAGDPCKTSDGNMGQLESDGKGGLVCNAVQTGVRLVTKSDNKEVARSYFTSDQAEGIPEWVKETVTAKGLPEGTYETQVMTKEVADKMDAQEKGLPSPEADTSAGI